MNEVELESWWRESCPLYEHIGLRVQQASGGIYRCAVPLSTTNSNHFQTMHAAIQMAVVEVLGGIVGMSLIPPAEQARVFGAVRALQIDFLRPARTALIAQTEFSPDQGAAIQSALAAGQNTEFRLESRVLDEGGELIARAVADYVLRPARSAPRA